MRFTQILLLIFFVSCNVAQMKPQIQAGAQGSGPNAGVVVSFTTDGVIGNEGFGYANLAFTLSEPLAADTTFTFSFAGSADGSTNCAISGTDYELPIGNQVALPAGSTSGILSLKLCQDSIFENSETIQVAFAASSPSVAVGQFGIIDYTLNDNLGRPSIAFRTVTTSVNELDSGSVLYDDLLGSHVEVYLTHKSVETVGVQIFLSGNAVIGSSCTAGVDYVYEGTVSFPVATIQFDPLEDSFILPLRVCADTVIEGNDTIVMALQAPVNASLGVQQDHNFAILNDDFVAGDTNIVASMFETITSSNNEGTTRNIWVTFNGAKDVATTLNYTIDSTTAVTTAQRATFNTDFKFTGTSTQTGSVTIPAGTTMINIPVQILQDSIYEPTESFFVRILPSDDIVPDSDPNLQITEVPIAIDPVDTKPLVVFSQPTQTVFESNIVYAIIVRLVDPVNQSLAKATGTSVPFSMNVNPVGADPYATINTDYFISTGLTGLSIPEGQTQLVIPLSIVQDGIDEYDEKFRVSLDLSASFDLNSGTYAAGATPSQDVTINDVDEAPQVSFSSMVTYTTSSAVSNTAYNFSFHFSRFSQKPVTVNFVGAGSYPVSSSCSGGPEIQVDNYGSVTFTPSASQTLNVNGLVCQGAYPVGGGTVGLSISSLVNGNIGSINSHTIVVD